ncbi:serine protein kinase [Stachybotrys elegans]|uniref:non-specific serine/threonine protein kinase n=1 Tax=Stachybotrys elegans TaxID=80388 RepID=A0A8K0WLV7_9HYPO|nr:serine protein kinase [Stachybotrys elegans]
MSSSPIVTPPSRSPNDDKWRFEAITLPCEWVEKYRPGGYHPVNLGDTFKDGQYKVIRKLGEGSYSTVWLAQDTLSGTCVALKIIVSEISQNSSESRVLRHLLQATRGREYVTELLDEFYHDGPNGRHKCLCFEPMGPSVNSMVEELPQFKPRKRDMKIRYPPWMAKRILKQSLKALEFLHSQGIAHGDFQPGNILFALPNINGMHVDTLKQQEILSPRPHHQRVKRLDGKVDKWAPGYLHMAQPLASLTPFNEGFRVKLSDMSGAYFINDPPMKIVVPIGLRAPELILTGSVNPALDIWSFGCLIFELITGRPLFCAFDPDNEDDDHIISLISAIGPLPDSLFKHWGNCSLYYTPDGKLFNCELGGVVDGEEPLLLEEPPLEELFDQTDPDLSTEEANEVKALIKRILQYDPAKRPTATELLIDPWFSAISL